MVCQIFWISLRSICWRRLLDHHFHEERTLATTPRNYPRIDSHPFYQKRYCFRTRNWSHIATHLVLLVGATAFKKARGSVVSNRIGKKYGTIVLHVNAHLLTESNFWYNVTLLRRRPLRLPAAWCSRVRRLPVAHRARACSSWSIARLYLLMITRINSPQNSLLCLAITKFLSSLFFFYLLAITVTT